MDEKFELDESDSFFMHFQGKAGLPSAIVVQKLLRKHYLTKSWCWYEFRSAVVYSVANEALVRNLWDGMILCRGLLCLKDS